MNDFGVFCGKLALTVDEYRAIALNFENFTKDFENMFFNYPKNLHWFYFNVYCDERHKKNIINNSI